MIVGTVLDEDPLGFHFVYDNYTVSEGTNIEIEFIEGLRS